MVWEVCRLGPEGVTELVELSALWASEETNEETRGQFGDDFRQGNTTEHPLTAAP
ncbi:Unannotated [Lentimonas sp. CC4]|nr:Unannotated [Lentimonas sp. CC4]CAA6685177.1 Unannotated [Lentimonas sp. CC6]CAA7075097.1 Unannotated [Lentimonas sp. CC4]CAA7168443.1 Unannotated [Lentimonas sp. CC21]CAA7182122.1 Unannotated [Lentimonas sp. CC8]